MSKFTAFILCLCCVFTSVQVKEDDHTSLNPSDANIVGHILDKKTGEYLSFVNVCLHGTTIGTTTDAIGHYYMKNLPKGKYTSVAKSIGYKTEGKTVTPRKRKTLGINLSAEENAVSLDGAVVSANRNEMTRRLAPSLVDIFDSKVFETAHTISLADGLNFQPGVRVEDNCQNCGFQQVHVNGLEGPYTQILADSRPIFNALTGVYGSEQILTNMIEWVEVMRGGGSALLGSSVIVGTVNITTKEPMCNSARIAHSLTVIGGNRPDNSTTVNASLVTGNHKADIYLFGQGRHRASYDHDGGGYSELSKLEAKTLGFRFYSKTSDYSELTSEYHNISGFHRDGDLSNFSPHETNITEQTDRQINGGGLKLDPFPRNYHRRLNVYTSAQYTKRQSYYGAGKDPNVYSNMMDMISIGGVQCSYEWDKCLSMPVILTRGTEYNYDDLQDEMLSYHYMIVQTVHIGSAFAQDEWKSDRWGFLIGGRLDKHNMMDYVIFSPRVNVRFNSTKGINLRMSYPSGFQAPQAFGEDLHITAVGDDVAIIQISPGLKEENSQSMSASVDFYYRFGSVQVNFLVEGFYMDLRNVFILEEIGRDEDGNLLMRHRNGRGVHVMSINLENEMTYSWMQMQAGATLQRSRYKGAEQWGENPGITPQKRMLRFPDVYGYFTSTFTLIKRFSASLTDTYTGSMLIQYLAGYIPEGREKKTCDFFDLNFKLAYDFSIFESMTLQINAGVQDTSDSYQDDFDRGAYRDTGYIYSPGIPGNYFVGCKISY